MRNNEGYNDPTAFKFQSGATALSAASSAPVKIAHFKFQSGATAFAEPKSIQELYEFFKFQSGATAL